jgi:DNA-binding NtrC family response regulator
VTTSKIRVVVIEPFEELRLILCDLLMLHGLECQATETSESARRAMIDFAPDVVVLDMQHEGARAFAMELYRRGRPSIGVIGMSTNGQQLEGAPLDVGLVKPFVTQALVDAVATTFRTIRLDEK